MPSWFALVSLEGFSWGGYQFGLQTCGMNCTREPDEPRRARMETCSDSLKPYTFSWESSQTIAAQLSRRGAEASSHRHGVHLVQSHEQARRSEGGGGP